MENAEKYLPHIDVKDGVTRVMNNLKLYTTLLKKFKVTEMTANLVEAIQNNNVETIMSVSHALRGTAANLSLPVLMEVTAEIETLAKSGSDSSHLIERLNTASTELVAAIEDLTS